MMKKDCARLTVLFVCLTTFSGCSSLFKTRSFLNPQADFSFYKKVGILPFKNQADDHLAGEKITEYFMTEVLIGGELDVMAPDQFNAIVAEITRSNAPVSSLELSPLQLSEIAKAADVQGILVGTVHDYKMVQLGGEQYPMIAMTVKLVDAPTGVVAWQNSVTATGGPNLPIVSLGEIFTLAELSQETCKTVVKDFYGKALED